MSRRTRHNGSLGSVDGASAFVSSFSPRLVQDQGRWALERAVADRRTRPLVMVGMGGSTWEGSVSTNDRMLALQVAKMLQAQLNPPGIRGGYALKVRAWETTTGTTGETADIDLMKHRTLTAGATVSHTTFSPFTGLRLHFLEGPAYGQFSIVLDGTTFTITPDTTKSADSPTGVWVSPVLARQVRTVTITAIGAASLGNAYFFDGDQNAGLQWYNAGRAGGSTSTFLNTASFWTRLATLQPDIVSVMLGFNDMGGNVPLTTYAANLNTIVDNIIAASPGKRVWVPMIAQHSFDPNNATWANYKATMKAVAASRPLNCTYVDYGQAIYSTRPADPNFEIVSNDDTHMTSLGHTVAAAQITELMAVGTRNTLPVDPPATDNLTWNYSADSALLGEWDANTLAGSNGSSVSSLAPSFGSLGLALTQATSGKQPTIVTGPNSRKALHFVASSSQELATTTFTADTTPATVMAVWRRTGSSGTRLWSGVSSTFLSCQVTSGTPYNYRLDTGTAPSASTPWSSPDTGWHIMIVVYNGANTLMYAQARTPVTLALASAQVNYNGFSLARNQTASAFADVEISALIAFSRALTSFEVGRLFDIWGASCAISVAN